MSGSLILYDMSSQAAYERAMKWKSTIAATNIDSSNGGFKIQFSAGIAEFPSHGANGEETIIHADQALYLAKELGRNRVVVYQKQA